MKYALLAFSFTGFVSLCAAERGVQLPIEISETRVSAIMKNQPTALDTMQEIAKIANLSKRVKDALKKDDDALIHLCMLLNQKTGNIFRSLYLMKAYKLIDVKRYNKLFDRLKKELPDEYKQQLGEMDAYHDIASEDTHVMMEYIQKGMDINLPLEASMDLYGKKHPAIFMAIKRGDVPFLKFLMSHPDIDINYVTNRDGHSLLHHAVLTSDLNVVSLLLSNPQIDVNGKTLKDKRTILIDAISSMADAIDDNVVRNVLRLIADPKILLEAQDAEGKTALHYATQICNYDIITKILQKPSAIDLTSIKDVRGITPLMNAQKYCQPLVPFLVEYQQKRKK